jgi:hypothetical protein
MTPSLRNRIADPSRRHQILVAGAICAVEIGIQLNVEILIVHMLVTIGLFGRETVEVLTEDGRERRALAWRSMGHRAVTVVQRIAVWFFPRRRWAAARPIGE